MPHRLEFKGLVCVRAPWTLLFSPIIELTQKRNVSWKESNQIRLRFQRHSSKSNHLCEGQMKRILVALLLITTLFFAFACERRGGPGAGGSSGTIVVGYYGDLSGRTSNFGQSTKNEVEMAADELNKAGGIDGRQIQILSEDDEGRPEKATTGVTKPIDQDRVIALLGEVASGNTLAAAPKAQAAKVPMISPSSTNPAVTQVGDYIFRVCFIDPFQGEVMAKFAANTLKAKHAAIMLDFNSPYSRGLTEFFEASFKKLGGQIVDKQSYTQGD